MSDVTQILSRIEHGDPAAAEQLLPLVYDELRKLAAAKLANERPGHTLQATALVHNAYVRLVDVEHIQSWNSRGHFFGAAAEAMRRILVDHARRKRRPIHGGGLRRVDLDEAVTLVGTPEDLVGTPEDLVGTPEDDVLAVHEALTKLDAESSEKAELVKLRYFAGMTLIEAAEVMGISRATASRYWAYAKAFLYCEMEDSRNG